MKISIDISDFYLDEDSDLEEGLKRYVKNEAITAIFGKIKDKVEVEIKRVVEKHVLENLSSEIAKAVQVGTIKKQQDRDPISIIEYVKECVLNSNASSWKSFEKTIEEVVKKFCDEIRKRYDLNFASNIVAKLIDNKLIKEDAVKMLLGDNNQK